MSANIVRQGTFKVIDVDTSEVLGSHNEITNAIETLLNERLNNPSRNIQMEPATYRLDLDIGSALQAAYDEGYAAGSGGLSPQTGMVITLKGDSEVTLNEGETYIEPGARVSADAGPSIGWSDLLINYSGDLQEISPNVYEYKITYTATDDIGNTASEVRTLTINTTDDVMKSVGGILTHPDESPDPFESLIIDQSSVGLGSTVTSNTFSPIGVDSFVQLAISVDIGTYSLNGAPHTSSPGIWMLGDTVELEHTASGINDDDTDQTVTIGGVLGTFTSTTEAAGAFDGFFTDGAWSTDLWYGQACSLGDPGEIECSSISTDGAQINWAGGANARLGKYTESTTAAASPNGSNTGGGRWWVEDGQNKQTGKITVGWAGATGRQKELWIRFYMRYQLGFEFNNGGEPGYDKTIYLFTGNSLAIIPQWNSSHPGGGQWAISLGSGGGDELFAVPRITWSDIFGATGDGLFHMIEIHVKMDTNQTDGIGRLWIDNILRGEDTSHDWSGGNSGDQLGFSYFEVYANQNEGTNAGGVGNPAYVDITDLAVYRVTPPNTDASGNPYIGPLNGFTGGY